MKKIKLSINLNKARNNPKFDKLIQSTITRLKPAVDYYNKLTEREKQILTIGGILGIIMVLYLFISAAYDFEQSVQKDYTIIQTYRADAEHLVKTYKDINQLTPNEFSTVDVERIKGDLGQITDSAPDVQQIGDTLTIKISQIKFSDIMNLLNQFRKSYGIFPLKLKMTRLSESGYVSFSASFKVNTQNEQ